MRTWMNGIEKSDHRSIMPQELCCIIWEALAGNVSILCPPRL
jgi:hypothetical protein